ncbi:hypothetical protein ILUMI_20826 [Ignelater luminosus]|uniref:Beta-defensin n=1 Tax=Ignelater luminosus TaxID=2038154 RepID=A0A8K0G1Z6_IGNLU|nr:hypothetical protein ILUMI_20826 [Ignelater luminosus]
MKLVFFSIFVIAVFAANTMAQGKEGDQCTTSIGVTIPITKCLKTCNNKYNPKGGCAEGLTCCSDINLPPELTN